MANRVIVVNIIVSVIGMYYVDMPALLYPKREM